MTTELIDPNAWREKPPWQPLVPPHISRPGMRNVLDYITVAKQFDVIGNPRYLANETRWGLPPGTYCNIYVWDVTSAMNAEAPHWVDFMRRRSEMAEHGATELDANALIDWFAEGRGGWRLLDDEREAYRIADTGRPVVAGYRSPLGHIGHVAMVMPNEVIAQAGRTNLWLERLTVGFGSLPVMFFGHH